MCVTASARHLKRAAVEPGEAPQLCLFILGMQYLGLGVLWVCLGLGMRLLLVDCVEHIQITHFGFRFELPSCP